MTAGERSLTGWRRSSNKCGIYSPSLWAMDYSYCLCPLRLLTRLHGCSCRMELTRLRCLIEGSRQRHTTSKSALSIAKTMDIRKQRNKRTVFQCLSAISPCPTSVTFTLHRLRRLTLSKRCVNLFHSVIAFAILPIG